MHFDPLGRFPATRLPNKAQPQSHSIFNSNKHYYICFPLFWLSPSPVINTHTHIRSTPSYTTLSLGNLGNPRVSTESCVGICFYVINKIVTTKPLLNISRKGARTKVEFHDEYFVVVLAHTPAAGRAPAAARAARTPPGTARTRHTRGEGESQKKGKQTWSYEERR